MSLPRIAATYRRENEPASLKGSSKAVDRLLCGPAVMFSARSGPSNYAAVQVILPTCDDIITLGYLNVQPLLRLGQDIRVA